MVINWFYLDEVIDLTKDANDRDEDLEKAIALSLQETGAPQVGKILF